MGELAILSIVIPFSTAVIILMFLKNTRIQSVLGFLGSLLNLIFSVQLLMEVIENGAFSIQLGNWPAPFGISFFYDKLSVSLILISSCIGIATQVFSYSQISKARERYGFHALLHFLIMSVNGCFLAGDLFNLFVWFELSMISSFVLLTLGGEKKQLEGAIKYVTLNIISTLFLLMAIGIIYGFTKTLNLADLIIKIQLLQNQKIFYFIALLLFISFGIKSAIFPFYFWLPASYHTPPIYISALFSGLLTKVGVYAFIRCFSLLFYNNPLIDSLFVFVAISTMIIGGIGAIVQTDMRRILSFHIISQIGYMLAGLAIKSPIALGSSVLFMIHNMINKYALFLIVGGIFLKNKSFNINFIGNTVSKDFVLFSLFLIPSFSLAGIPPFSGFFAKLMIALSSLNSDHLALAITTLFVSVLTLYSMIKVLNEAFLKKHPDTINKDGAEVCSLNNYQKITFKASIIFMVSLSILFSFYFKELYSFSLSIGEEIANPAVYSKSVIIEK
jgi:multicomponent Na+:H+ antiporter subunit D